MPHSKEDPEQQFQAVEALITGWLKERRQVLSRYTEIVVTLDSEPEQTLLDQRQQQFCEVLVDYVSAGHFEIFVELINEAESFADGSSSAAERVMPVLGDTTEVILAYEEKYANAGDINGKLKRDLSSLGEVLETRFMLEDQLIASLHNSHRRQ